MRDHPTVQRFHELQAQQTQPPENPRVLEAEWLRQLCLDCGADDVGFVELDRPAMAVRGRKSCSSTRMCAASSVSCAE